LAKYESQVCFKANTNNNSNQNNLEIKPASLQKLGNPFELLHSEGTLPSFQIGAYPGFQQNETEIISEKYDDP
jgi:hypothetical protein